MAAVKAAQTSASRTPQRCEAETTEKLEDDMPPCVPTEGSEKKDNEIQIKTATPAKDLSNHAELTKKHLDQLT